MSHICTSYAAVQRCIVRSAHHLQRSGYSTLWSLRPNFWMNPVLNIIDYIEAHKTERKRALPGDLMRSIITFASTRYINKTRVWTVALLGLWQCYIFGRKSKQAIFYLAWYNNIADSTVQSDALIEPVKGNVKRCPLVLGAIYHKRQV
jgi:hypothetical protein